MLTAVNGHYNGKYIIMDEHLELIAGQKVIITVLDYVPAKKKEIDLRKYMGRGEKMFLTDAGEYVKELRSNDRF